MYSCYICCYVAFRIRRSLPYTVSCWKASWKNYYYPNNMELYTFFTIKDKLSLDKLSSNLSKDQFRKTRKYLESFYVQQLNQPQTNNVTEGREEGDVRRWRLTKPPLRTATTHVRSTTINWKRLGVDDMKRSLPIWIHGLLWTISRTTVTTQRQLL